MGLNFGVFFGESTTLNKQTNLSSGAERCWPQNFQHARQISAQRFKNGKMMSIGSEFGGIADEDKRALLITESPAALKQHLAMHAATLTTYEQVCAVVVSYLQAKRVWIPTATYAAGHTARARDPDAMNVDKIDDKKGKGKGKQEKGKKGEGKRKGDGKKKQKGEHGKNTGKNEEREKCAICWRNHSTQECWYNAKGQGKQSKDGTSGKGRGNIQSVSDENTSTAPTSVGPSVSHAGIPAGNGWRIVEIRDPSCLRSRTCNANRESNGNPTRVNFSLGRRKTREHRLEAGVGFLQLCTW